MINQSSTSHVMVLISPYEWKICVSLWSLVSAGYTCIDSPKHSAVEIPGLLWSHFEVVNIAKCSSPTSKRNNKPFSVTRERKHPDAPELKKIPFILRNACPTYGWSSSIRSCKKVHHCGRAHKCDRWWRMRSRDCIFRRWFEVHDTIESSILPQVLILAKELYEDRNHVDPWRYHFWQHIQFQK